MIDRVEKTTQNKLCRHTINSWWPLKGHMYLKVQSCKLYKNRYIIAPTQLTNTEMFAFISVLVLMLLNRKILFINRKDNRNC